MAMPTYIEIDPMWKHRERTQFINGVYTHPPFNFFNWYYPISGHYAHVAVDDNTQIAYTPSTQFGLTDRQVRMRPGKYLKKFYTGLDDDEIGLAVARWKSTYNAELSIATDPDDIEHIYIHGPTSCMGGGYDFSDLPCHPSRVYGAGDLAVAWCGPYDSPSARCICYPSKHIYSSTCYGDYQLLESLLDSSGYSKVNCSSGEWEDARLLVVGYGGGYVMPYLDIAMGIRRDGSYFRLTNSNYEFAGQSTAGYVPDAYCDRCEGSVDSVSYLEVAGESWCDSCISDYTFCCDECCERELDENGRHGIYNTRHGYTQIMCETCADENMWQCETCDETYTNEVPRHEYDYSFYCETCHDDIVAEGEQLELEENTTEEN